MVVVSLIGVVLVVEGFATASSASTINIILKAIQQKPRPASSHGMTPLAIGYFAIHRYCSFFIAVKKFHMEVGEFLCHNVADRVNIGR